MKELFRTLATPNHHTILSCAALLLRFVFHSLTFLTRLSRIRIRLCVISGSEWNSCFIPCASCISTCNLKKLSVSLLLSLYFNMNYINNVMVVFGFHTPPFSHNRCTAYSTPYRPISSTFYYGKHYLNFSAFFNFFKILKGKPHSYRCCTLSKKDNLIAYLFMVTGCRLQ